ncbi:MAG: tryptophan-rich sensory protein [Citromicrobium sp.]|nr:tryptophan-rich sensory protein [Citromicrobium sp.]MAO97177.1 tryptophan-rich sensory protein [Citromicrobium sp.]MBD75698.1 tryptophan-rich sensory protein [Citromicrobium sp.]MBT46718.1 tryptophan-rich sensory protein [Citromicrobium sp.]|tara:strand:+ start:1008 stop:1562 length:555 start_codon:yes stop_codon:yes gene_type:complete
MTTLASRAQLRASFIRWALFCVPAVVLLGFLSGQLAGSGAGDPWYDALAKPEFQPDPSLFPIVWSILYVMMGLALALVCSAWGAKGRGIAIVAFLIQFALNLGWSPLFFGQHEITYAFYLMIALSVMIFLTIVLFFRVRKMAAVLLIPYFAWALFATYLNYEIMQLNPEADGSDTTGAVQRIDL